MDLIAECRRALDGAGVADGLLGLAVSGGADSTAMLHLVREAAGPLGLQLHVLHVDHRLRAESAADADSVAGLCEDLGIPCTILRAEIVRPARRSPEEVARDVRYLLLDHAAHALGCRWVATAHTLDDRAETVLLRLVRGTSVDGLGALPAVRGRFVRPLIGVTRALLREWLSRRRIGWREDPTNLDLGPERNWLRHEILPRLAERRPGAPRAVARLAAQAAVDADYLAGVARGAYARAVRGPGRILLPASLACAHPAVAGRVLVMALRDLGTGANHDRVDMLTAMLRGGGPSSLCCGPNLCAKRTPAGLLLLGRRPAPPAPVRLPGSGEAFVGEWGLRVRVGGRDRGGWWTCTLDPAGRTDLWLRSRRPGDRVRTGGGTRKVQDVLVDAKVPAHDRDCVPILAVGERAVAVVGLTVPPSTGDHVVTIDPLDRPAE